MSKIGYKTESERKECKELAYKMLWAKFAKLQAENEQLRKILAEEIDDGRAEVDDIGVDAWIEQALIAKGGGQAEGEGGPSTTNNTNPQSGTDSGL